MAKQNAKNIALWVVTVLLAGVFLLSGGSKLAGAEVLASKFEYWGYPSWFPTVVGVVEIVAAALLLIPKTASIGGTLIVVVMAGATYTHLLRASGQAGEAVATLVLLALAALVGYARFPREG